MGYVIWDGQRCVKSRVGLAIRTPDIGSKRSARRGLSMISFSRSPRVLKKGRAKFARQWVRSGWRVLRELVALRQVLDVDHPVHAEAVFHCPEA